MAYKDNVTLALGDATFRDAIAGAMSDVALDVNGEAQGGMSDRLWRARSVLANEISRQPQTWITAFALAAKTYNEALNANSTDADLYAACSAVFNDIALPQAVS